MERYQAPEQGGRRLFGRLRTAGARRQTKVAVAALLATIGLLGTGIVAEALTGASATCNDGHACVSGDWHTPGSTTTTMTHGYQFWNENPAPGTVINLYSRFYSGGGGEVGGNGVSLRNKDLHQRNACYYRWNENIQSYVLYVTNTYAYVGWANVGSPGNMEGYRPC